MDKVKSCSVHCMNCQHKMCAKKVPIFSNLESKQLEMITGVIIRKKYRKGEVIFLQGSLLDGLYIINNGKIKIFKYTKEGKEQILYILSDGDFFGELSLLKAEEVSFNAEAIEDVNICMIQKKDFDKILALNPEISVKILNVIGGRLSKLETLVQSLGTKDVEARIAQMLLDLAEEFGVQKKNSIEMEIPLTREDMANFIGVTRETISRKLSLLQNEGIIDLIGNRKIIIFNIEDLKEFI
ncbi:Crp/Fnr family transcriptional regulator [Alkaliphilus sp. MSJ-5]|uniref:Crp/Fnr family transcriptional regulator n=1 Tax=Alkaliphilus flagellatus TaxID=2841507 RepID=A0ABS6G403_9FIRM|nr:Crp/Fnr family transcriptional regulator [Alkaliphilus flagellatus]MBU5677103.1 Crp/Fnr family transcriptional regulator [Alkaliphilus flagellatus]